MSESGRVQSTWTTAGFGWFGVLSGAFDRADIFGRFTEQERQALAHVASECVAGVLDEKCAARNMPGPGRGPQECGLHRGHPGPHVERDQP